MTKLNSEFFVIENKELTLNGLKYVKDALNFVHQNVKLLEENKSNKNFDTQQTCKELIAKLSFLIKVLDTKKKNFNLSKDLDHLYKHCVFCVLRVRDHKDYAFIKGCLEVLSEISEGWDRLTSAVENYPSVTK